ncbi:MAG: UDP-glucose 4-epimerase GalE [Oscillospiraceae bacterium]|nr:UDP-glucose 4-epimerase GalE [Oscillospiraceae bacterium]
MKQILVTGGMGYIGSHTCVELLNAGYGVIILDDLSNSKEAVLGRIETLTGKRPKFYRSDLCNDAATDRVFAENDIDGVIHFAGYKAVGESVEKPIKYYRNNIGGAMVLCEKMEKYGCRKLIFSSSATVYGLNNPIPYTEEMPTSAFNPYGQTKVMQEQLFRDVCAADQKFSAVLLRYFNPIGAHESGLLGEDPNGIPNNLFPYIAKVAVGELPMVHVFGGDYDTPDGTGVRDYIHVADLARGHVNALAFADAHKGATAINLGTGKGTSVLEIIAAFEKACGHKLPYAIEARRPGDLPAYYARTELAEKLLGWKAEKDIDDMCRDGWKFIQEEKKRQG